MPTIAPEAGDQGLVGQRLPGCLGHAEVDDFGHRLAVIESHQHVGRLEIAVDDALLMRMLDRLADGDEEFEPLARREVVLVAVPGDRHAFDEVHDKVRPARIRWYRHQARGPIFGWSIRASRLPLGLESGDDLLQSPSPP